MNEQTYKPGSVLQAVLLMVVYRLPQSLKISHSFTMVICGFQPFSGLFYELVELLLNYLYPIPRYYFAFFRPFLISASAIVSEACSLACFIISA